jgi:DNA-directed RNA polymerase specialized sigma24 family protein
MGARADGDLEAVQSLAEMIDRARDTLGLAVDGCRGRGYSDGEIGAALGISRQGVGQRFGRKREVYTGPAERAGA